MDKKYIDYMTETVKELMAVDSPTGFCGKMAKTVAQKAEALGFRAKISNKDGVEVFVDGSGEGNVGIAAHIDTLGAMVREITGSGKLRFKKMGGASLPTWDGEYCRIYTRDGRVYTGTFLADSCSVHVYKDAHSAERTEANMYVRLDERVKSADDVAKLGIMVGDYVAIDTKTTVTESGYIKSRFLDDKASVAILFTALKIMSDKKIKPIKNTRFIFTAYEELGHGGAPYGEGLDEVLAVDMGCIGADLKCTEEDVSICPSDSRGPYSYDFVGRLIDIAKRKQLSFAVDVYPFYGSDVGAMLSAGRDIKGGLIGPGVHASHGMERTHINGMVNTLELLMAYLTEE